MEKFGNRGFENFIKNNYEGILGGAPPENYIYVNS